MPPSIEVQVEFITSAIADAEKSGVRLVEATHEGEKEYSELCDELAANSLFWKAEVGILVQFNNSVLLMIVPG
jgi:hypothetical protein